MPASPNVRPRPSAFRFFLYTLIKTIRPAALGAILKRLLRVEREVIEVERGRFFIDPGAHLGYQLLKYGEYEPEMFRVFSALLKPGDIFVDLGANEGYFTVVASKLVGPTGRVVSIEPQRRLKPVFEKNVALNGLQNVSLTEQAVSDKIGEATIHVSPSTDTGATGLVLNYKYSVPTETIQTTTLAEVFRKQNLQHCDLIKIDIEGFEYEAVLGSKQLFEQGRIRKVVLQLHPRLMTMRGLNPDDITKFVTGCGYTRDERFEELVYVAPGVAKQETPRGR